MLGGKKGKVIKADFGKPFVKEITDDDLKQKMAKEKARTQRISGNLRADNMNRYEIGRPKLDKDEYDYYRDILGEDAEYDYYPVKGDETREFLEAMVKEQEDEVAYMKRLYDKGALDPKPGERGRKKFLDRKAQKGDEMTPEEIEELKKLSEDPEDMATGGRAGFDKGGMSRRKFMKIMGGLAALPVVGKLFKVGKVASKVPQVVKTQPVAGKPEWFDSLVNKVIAEGDDVTKKLATKEREIVHTKKIDEDSTVTVTRDLDEGIVRVEYDSPENTFADTVQLQYRKPLPDEANPNPKAQFDVAESGPVGRSVGPEDYEIELDEVGGTSIRHLDSDVSKLKEYATGKKPTLKEFVQNKKRKDKAKAITEDPAAQSDAVTARQGEYDGPYEDDFASGGIARLLGE